MRSRQHSLLARSLMLLCVAAAIATLTNLTSRVDVFVMRKNHDEKRFSIDEIPSEERHSLCTQNPYAPSMNKSLVDIARGAHDWLELLPRHLNRANSTSMSQHTHKRFFPFEPLATCEQSCIGGPCGDDKSKIMCGIERLREGCIVYSIGGNNQWQFENDLLKRTPCEIHTFDCTGNIKRFKKPDNSRLKFHHICLADTSVPAPQNCSGTKVCGEMMTIEGMQNMLGHERIDLLKMDIEGFEWPIFESWRTILNDTRKDLVLPFQILVEVHYRTQFKELFHANKQDFKSPKDIVMLQQHLLQMGYVTAVRDDNIFCKHCSELTLVRFQCSN